MRLCAPLSLLLAFVSLQAQNSNAFPFRVSVVDSLTKKPLVNVAVALSMQHADQITGRTDSAGVFAGHAPVTGSYLLQVARKGYRPLDVLSFGRKIEVKSGAETSVTVQMLPLGVIAGRIVDPDGNPVSNAIVRTEDEVHLPGEQPTFQSNNAATTDDLGQYRIANVEPGKHFVAVEYNSEHIARTLSFRPQIHWPTTGATVLYPHAATIDQAQPVEIAAGETKHLIDIPLDIRPPVTISGSIKPASSDETLNLDRQDHLSLATTPLVQSSRPGADGSFKMEVLPGRYVLTATDAKTGATSQPVTLNLSDKDMGDIELALSAPFEISGRFTTEGSETLDFSKLGVSLGNASSVIDSNGSFHALLPGGKGHYFLFGIPDGWYVKQVLLSGRPLTSRRFEIEPGVSELTFVFAPHAARVEVSVPTAPGSLPPAIAILLPDTGPLPDAESTLHAESRDPAGFIFPSVPPGAYRLFVLDISAFELVLRPDLLLEQHRSAAPLITVAEGDRKTLTAQVIKVDAP